MGKGIKSQMRDWFYILDEQGEPHSTTDPLVWSEWWARTDRHVAHTMILNVEVSTVFLGINHNWMSKGAPVLWETMIFAPKPLAPIDLSQWRYTSKAQAIEGHEQVVAMVRKLLNG